MGQKIPHVLITDSAASEWNNPDRKVSEIYLPNALLFIIFLSFLLNLDQINSFKLLMEHSPYLTAYNHRIMK